MDNSGEHYVVAQQRLPVGPLSAAGVEKCPDHRFVQNQYISGGESSESSSPNETDSYIGLSPPTESLLMQRRLRMRSQAAIGIPIASQSGQKRGPTISSWNVHHTYTHSNRSKQHIVISQNQKKRHSSSLFFTNPTPFFALQTVFVAFLFTLLPIPL